MDIQNELFIGIKNLLGNPWSVTVGNLEAYGACIKQAARDVSELRRTGKGPDGSSVLFPHLPYLLEEDVLISEEEKKNLLSLREEAKSYDMRSFPSASAVPIWEIRCFLISSAVPTGTSSLKKSGRDIPRFIFPARM